MRKAKKKKIRFIKRGEIVNVQKGSGNFCPGFSLLKTFQMITTKECSKLFQLRNGRKLHTAGVLCSDGATLSVVIASNASTVFSM
jgi:hypothetical protein